LDHDEHGFTGGLTIVSDHVREKKRRSQEVLVPLSHAPSRAQVEEPGLEALPGHRCPREGVPGAADRGVGLQRARRARCPARRAGPGRRPFVWLDATYLKARQHGRIVSVAAIVAVGANAEGRCEILGLAIGPSEAETFWSDFLRSLNRRGLTGVKLVISDAHEGLKAAAAKVLGATWQRCRVHFMRNALAHAHKNQREMIAAMIGGADHPFAQRRRIVAPRDPHGVCPARP
jgi:hypothetical protein